MDNVENTVELTAAEKLAQMEKEKLSRRQALARFGFQAGAAAVAALTADDLLRKVGKEMQRRAGDNKVAQQVAKELSQAGVANALPLKLGDINFVVKDLCGDDCISNCTPSVAATCESCYFLCAGLSYPAYTECTSVSSRALCLTCCDMQYNICVSLGGTGCDVLLCQQHCYAKWP